MERGPACWPNAAVIPSTCSTSHKVLTFIGLPDCLTFAPMSKLVLPCCYTAECKGNQCHTCDELQQLNAAPYVQKYQDTGGSDGSCVRTCHTGAAGPRWVRSMFCFFFILDLKPLARDP